MGAGGRESVSFFVIAGLDPAIHESPHEDDPKQRFRRFHVDARVERGHDSGGVETAWIGKPDTRGSSPAMTRKESASV
jgi:hypothetical protein